jgi:prepilin-type N-terminal cleavage/methylation domain-containing protein/prepilin-type processing-associated H-X9-DG protein
MGFTLTELLVVIAVIGILAGLLFPALAFGRFKSRVTTCTNNYRQLALAAAMYASDDPRGRLPSFELPTESSQLLHFHNLYPWIVGLPMFKAMERRGISQPKMWFCPLRQGWHYKSETFQWKFGRPLISIDDLIKESIEIQKSRYAALDFNWWVPRRLEGSSTLTFPDASLLPSRLKTPWPSKMDDATIATRPIISDWITGSRKTTGDSFAEASGAHSFARKIRNCNSAYADGHVETRAASDMKWELQLGNVGDNSYIFY